jgi:hypothetical protein
MTRIGLLSDTHSWLDPQLEGLFDACDEIWHAGDIGDLAVADALAARKPLRAVYGNIDDAEGRARFPLNLHFELDGVSVFITHIGGYPGKYTARVRALLRELHPKLYICGHSHILKIMPDPSLGLLHLNPGACGQEGFHLMRTALRFSLHEGAIRDMEVIELGKRGAISI